jgi:hypothetical protein
MSLGGQRVQEIGTLIMANNAWFIHSRHLTSFNRSIYVINFFLRIDRQIGSLFYLPKYDAFAMSYPIFELNIDATKVTCALSLFTAKFTIGRVVTFPLLSSSCQEIRNEWGCLDALENTK